MLLSQYMMMIKYVLSLIIHSIEERSTLCGRKTLGCYKLVSNFEILEVSEVSVLSVERTRLSVYIVTVVSLTCSIVVVSLLWW